MWIQGHQYSSEETQMNPIKTLFVIAALTVSSLAMAEGGGDRTFARMEAARNNSMESYQVAKRKMPNLLSQKAKPKRWTTRIAE
jgi:hypothetical protein